MAFKYDPDADALLIETAKGDIDYAREAGDLIVHFDKKHHPVLLEVLNATSFLTQAKKSLPKNVGRHIFSQAQ